MAVEVLQSKQQNSQARVMMRDRNVNFVSAPPLRLIRRLRLLPGVNVGDSVKSWDVLKTIEFLEARVSKNSPILEVGAYASEAICALHQLGYTNLIGIDLNTKLHNMPFNESCRYIVGDMMATSLPDCSVTAITAISVLEHGFDCERLFDEFSRLLKPGGYFVASIDYWPDKIDTSSIRCFGTDWRIFSREEVLDLIRAAGARGLKPVGDIRLDASNRTINWQGKEYTFAWMALQKR